MSSKDVSKKVKGSKTNDAGKKAVDPNVKWEREFQKYVEDKVPWGEGGDFMDGCQGDIEDVLLKILEVNDEANQKKAAEMLAHVLDTRKDWYESVLYEVEQLISDYSLDEDADAIIKRAKEVKAELDEELNESE